MLPSLSAAILALSVFALPASSQFLSGLPQCIRNCIDESSTDCEITDIACLCRASSGNFLPSIVSCMNGKCTDIDTSVLLAPLKLACILAGAPIPDDAVHSAENEGGSTQNGVTRTVTKGESPTISTATVTTTEEGSTWTLVYPVTIQKTTTISGEPSTFTDTSTRDDVTAFIPVIIISTDDEGSVHTMTSTQSVSKSTYTTTDSDGSTITEVSTYTEVSSSETSESTSSSSSSSPYSESETEESTTTSTTLTTSATVAGTAISSTDSLQSSAQSSRGSQTSDGTPATQTNSAPFMDTNSEATKTSVGALVGLGILAFAFALA